MTTKKAKTRKAASKKRVSKKIAAKRTTTKKKGLSKMDKARKVMKCLYPKKTRKEILPVLIKEVGTTPTGVHNYYHMIRTEMDKAARRKAPRKKRATKKAA